MVEGEHRGNLPKVLVALIGVSGCVGAGFVGWLVASGGDKVVHLASDPGPLAVEANVSYTDSAAYPGALTSEQLQELANDHNNGSMRAFTAAHKGAPVQGVFDLIVYGTRNHPLIIRSIEAIDVDCHEPTGLWTRLQFEEGGGLPLLPGTIKLEDGATPSDTPGGPRHWTFPRQVSTSEADDFGVFVTAPANMVCSFDLQISYTDEGHQGRKVVSNGSIPFELAGNQVGAGRTIEGNDLPEPTS